MSPQRKGNETSSKNRQAQLVQGFQHMVQTLTRPREAEVVPSGAVIEGMVEVRAEGEGDVPWCGENPQRGPGGGCHSSERKGEWSGHQNLSNSVRNPPGDKRGKR